jgi:hypothetical protein
MLKETRPPYTMKAPVPTIPPFVSPIPIHVPMDWSTLAEVIEASHAIIATEIETAIPKIAKACEALRIHKPGPT